MSAAGPPFLYVFWPTVLWMQYDVPVVRGLEDRGREGRVRVVVGVERLHTRDGGANVRLCGGLLGASPEAEIRRDRDCEQDPDDDDHDKELDEGEAPLTLLLRDPLAEPLNHERTSSFDRAKACGGSRRCIGLWSVD